jgi:hypothetical protein
LPGSFFISRDGVMLCFEVPQLNKNINGKAKAIHGYLDIIKLKKG